MARLARVVIPDLPHHITQRGNRRGQVFFSNDDDLGYRDLIAPPPSGRARGSSAMR